MSVRETLLSGAAELGLALDPQALEGFEANYALLSEANQVMDLTAVEGEEETARRHFLDSLSLLRFADFRAKRVIDVGSGAGGAEAEGEVGVLPQAAAKRNRKARKSGMSRFMENSFLRRGAVVQRAYIRSFMKRKDIK